MIENITKTHFGVYGVCRAENKILLIKKARGPDFMIYPVAVKKKTKLLKKHLFVKSKKKQIFL